MENVSNARVLAAEALGTAILIMGGPRTAILAAVVVFGVDSAAGAVIAAAAIIGLDAGVTPGASTIAIGAAALLLGRMPGGLLYTLRRIGASVAERQGGRRPLPPVRLSPAGRAALERVSR